MGMTSAIRILNKGLDEEVDSIYYIVRDTYYDAFIYKKLNEEYSLKVWYSRRRRAFFIQILDTDSLVYTSELIKECDLKKDLELIEKKYNA